MKRATITVLLLLLLSVASLAADKYIAKEYGFSITPQGTVTVEKEGDSGQVTFMAPADDKTWVGVVSTFTIDKDVSEDNAYPALDSAIDKLGETVTIDQRRHVLVQDHPGVKAIFSGTTPQGEKYRGLAMFVYAQSTKRVYYVAAETRMDHQHIEDCATFMESFEILE